MSELDRLIDSVCKISGACTLAVMLWAIVVLITS